MIAALAILALGAAIAFAVTHRRAPATSWTPPVEYAPAIQQAATGTVDVCALRIGIDGRASKFVRTELEAIAKTYADGTPDTRARKLREVSVMLRRVRDSWIYGGTDNEPMRSPEDAFATFAKHVETARTRLRGGPPVTTPQGPPVSLILVSVIIAARGELMTVTTVGNGEELRLALEAASHRPADEILALEVVWVPEGVVESIDLESVYSRAELHPLEGVTVGKVFCTFCNGPFPAELVSCPHCGGTAPGRERRA